MTRTAFGEGFLLSLSMCLDLGVVNLAIIRTALARGGARAFLIGLGSCFGDLTYLALGATGVARLLEWRPLRWAAWLGGVVMLGYLSWRAIREALRPKVLETSLPATTLPESGAARDLVVGLSLALGSPTAILWFAAIGGSVMASRAGDGTPIVPFVLGFFSAGLAWSLFVAVGTASLGRAAGPRAIRILSSLSAILFAAMAVWVAVDGARALLFAP